MRRLSALLVAVLFIGAGDPGSARAADTDVIDALALVPSGALYLESAEKKPFAPGSVRWSRLVGQFGGPVKLASGCRQAASLSTAPISYASSGVRPPRVE